MGPRAISLAAPNNFSAPIFAYFAAPMRPHQRSSGRSAMDISDTLVRIIQL